jgi:SAM-dependent methyltransferase
MAKADDKTTALLLIIKGELAARPRRIRRALVVGCGDGQEAGLLAQLFDCQVTAIDVEDTFRCADLRVQFRRMDARAMQFEDCSFDLVYSFHALEHIREPCRAVKEIARVLADGGVYCIGTPTRSRLIGYIGYRVYWECRYLMAPEDSLEYQRLGGAAFGTLQK